MKGNLFLATSKSVSFFYAIIALYTEKELSENEVVQVHRMKAHNTSSVSHYTLQLTAARTSTIGDDF